MTMMEENPSIAWKISEWIFTREMIFMNMEVSNEELHKLLTKFMDRLDKMDKERDVMKKKLDRLSQHVSDVNKAIDEVYDIMNDGEVQIDHLTEEEVEHVKRISNLIQDKEVDFLDDDEFNVLIHSVVGES
mgnify:FL=1